MCKTANEQEQKNLHQQQLKQKDIYDTMQAKVSTVREKMYHQRSGQLQISSH
jgi:hypothetical protein